MTSESTFTKFAPAKRASEEEVRRQIALFKKEEMLEKFISKIPALFLIINEYRQVVYMNKGALEFSGLQDITSVVGKRPGEIFGCSHADEEINGCGTSESCTFCGAVRAVLSSLQGKATVEDAELFLGPNEEAYDLRVWAAPLLIENEKFSAVTMQDIRHEKRRFALERIFFHDVINTITGLKSTMQLLINHPNQVNRESFLEKLELKVNQLIDQIQSQQLLIEAENKALKIKLSKFNSLDFIKGLCDSYSEYSILSGKAIVLDEQAESISIISDEIILRRILENAIKNAFEAIPKGEKVMFGCYKIDDCIQFRVHNPGFIPYEVQLRIFQRYYSTKDAKRGLGTYSMKPLSKFLNGKVAFSSSERDGTQFMITIPIEFK